MLTLHVSFLNFEQAFVVFFLKFFQLYIIKLKSYNKFSKHSIGKLNLSMKENTIQSMVFDTVAVLSDDDGGE